jgi:hypothetical protein
MFNRLRSSFKIFKKSNKNIGNTNVLNIPETINASKAVAENSQPKAKGMKAMMKKYGKVGLISYTITYVSGFIGFFTALHYNLISIEGIKGYTKDTFIDKTFNFNQKIENANPKYVKAGKAFIINDCFDIIRLPLLLVFLKMITKK